MTETAVARWGSACDRRRRGGFALHETIGMMTAAGMLMSLAMVVLHAAFDSHSRALAQLAALQQMQQAADRLRRDAHQAHNGAAEDSLKLVLNDSMRVSYEVAENRLVRSLWQSGEIVGQEHWKLPATCKAVWQLDAGGPQPIVRCELEFSGEGAIEPVQWVARLSVHHALETRQSGEET